MALDGIFNLIVVDPDTALAGMPSAEQLQAVGNEGYDLVINLAPEDQDGALADEASVARKVGLEYINIAVPWDAPSRDHYDRFAATLDAAKGKRVFIHCMANYRVTAFYAVYGVRKLGWTMPRAQALMDRIWNSRDDYRMDETWSAFVKEAMGRSAQPGSVAGE